jgi:hypothetical protein
VNRLTSIPPWLLKVRSVVASAAYGTVTTVLAVIAGLLGSVYQSDVANAFPLVWSGPWEGWSIRALAFWASVVVFAGMFFLRQRSDDNARSVLAKAAAAAEENTRRIEGLVQTLPPRAFQTQLAEMFVTVHAALDNVVVRSVRSFVVAEDLISVIRSLLHSVASLAALYDGQPMTDRGAALYSANVMLFVPRGTESSPFPAGLRLLFQPEEYDERRLKGVLVLRQDLSSTSVEPVIDSAVPAIALPVPEVAERDGRWIALPGAPRAFLLGEADGYADTDTITDWAERKGNFPPSVRDALRRYFSEGEGRGIRSFISRPIGLAGDGATPLGVLNIHANRPNLLGPSMEKRQIFQALLTPVLVELADALQALVRLEAAATRVAQPERPALD